MYEEVEISTPLELARYLINEGDLYEGKLKTRLAAEDTKSSSPFFCYYAASQAHDIQVLWEVHTRTYYKKLNWHDRIPEDRKVPCYVSNKRKPTVHDKVVLIESYHNDEKSCCFEDTNGTSWDHATPTPADELWVPEL